MKQIGSVQHVVKEQQQRNPVAPEPRLRYKVRRVKLKGQRSTTGNVPVSSRMSNGTRFRPGSGTFSST